LFLWRISDGQLLWNAVKNSMAIAFSPDGKYLAYSSIDDGNAVVLASPDASEVVLSLPPMQSAIWEMFFSPDSTLLAATDGIEIRIWTIPTGTLRYVGIPQCP
jgi:WD40 repeat protein